MDTSKLKITRARENNLKDISLEIPHDELTVVTGISGSGKSSLAFDTVYAEGQRRYIETFSPYTRQFLDRVKRPNVDVVENVRPAIAIQQRTRVLSSRSTVGSMTNINDYLKLLWSNIAVPVCPTCSAPFNVWKPSALAQLLVDECEKSEGLTLLIGAFADFSSKPFKGEVERLISLGFSRFYRASGHITISLEEATDADLVQDKLLLVLDRLRGGAQSTSILKRARESVEQGYSIGGNSVVIINPASAREEFREYSSVAICKRCKISVSRPRPALFSYNHPLGACEECRGFGKTLEVDPQRIIPKPILSIEENAVQCWSSAGRKSEYRRLLKFCAAQGIPIDKSWMKLSPDQQQLILTHKSREYRGVLPWFKLLERKIYKMHVRVFLAKYRTQRDCPKCNGTRLKLDSLAYRIDGKTIADTAQLPISELRGWIGGVFDRESAKGKFPRQLKDVFSATLARLDYLINLGLPYLTLDRQSRTLSGGETQRVNLATALGSDLISTHFVLDEPSVGLHARDTERLTQAVRGLQERGNSLLIVEHDTDCINAADHIIEIGPQAGLRGGEIVYNGPKDDWPGIDLTRLLPSPKKDFAPKKTTEALVIKNACGRNLKGFTVSIPLQSFVCLTGVSGSGKSTLVHEVIKRAYDALKHGTPIEPYTNIVTGLEQVAQVLIVDQSPLAKSPRANIATYTSIWDRVRDLLAGSDDAQGKALGKSAFSFNVEGGRCPACSGAGFIREDMQFLSDVYIQCEVCLGKRFQESVLQVKYKGRNAHDFLQMSIDECESFFAEESKIASAAKTLKELGLGHLTLGHPLSELSGGEAQRLKLVPFIEQSNTAKSLLIFDEPTTGLHAYDVQRLISLFKILRLSGHSILCIEHNLALIAASDWVIDLGPEGGEGGGAIVATGTPAELMAGGASHTAQHLKRFIEEITSPRKTKKLRVASKVKREKAETMVIRGAREHNLKDIDVSIPLNKIVALTGVSGSGKSSIAKDIVYAEGQRRYLDCLSPYARQFIQELKRPEIDSISNVKPSICVYQHTFQPSRHSTIGTMSEAYNYLRLLYAKVGTQYCPEHPTERISPLSAQEIAEEIKKLSAKSVRLLAPVIKLKKGNHRAVLERAVASEISQVRIDGVFLTPGVVGFEGGLEKSKVHTIEFVVGKFSPASAPIELIQEAVSQCLSLGGGNVIVHAERSETLYSVERTCPVCKRGFFKPDPEDLSFHSKRGRCEDCNGAGRDEDGAICSTCGGSRINEIGRNLRLDSKNIAEATALTPYQLEKFLAALNFTDREKVVSEPVLRELYARLDTISAVGLDYLPLQRDCSTLSGGELQRLRLATAMGSPLTGAMYIFDEPSAGLHPLDNRKVLSRLEDLKGRGNSIIMIEHDAESILAAEQIIEVGPGGGREGGEIVFSGTPTELLEQGKTATSQALRAPQEVSPVQIPPTIGFLRLRNGSCNNVKDLQLEVPLGQIVTFCGVSGAGKSSVVHGLISETIQNGKTKGLSWIHKGCTIESSVEIARVLQVDQKPIGINSRSTPVSYLGIFDHLRNMFANALEAKSRGWKAGFFSYNTGKGRCSECKGLGEITLEMNFLPDASVTCETCGGKRYSDEANSVLYQGMTVSDVLNFTFEEAKVRFANHRHIFPSVRQACDLGLGYLKLGQSSTTLSGGESQRIKLVAELSASRKGHTIYVLDEPTTGLHKADVARLMRTLRELVDRGNSVLLIEHDPDVLLKSDHLIEIGPGPGNAGGKVIFKGAPVTLLKDNPHTPWGEIFAANQHYSDKSVQIGKPVAF